MRMHTARVSMLHAHVHTRPPTCPSGPGSAPSPSWHEPPASPWPPSSTPPLVHSGSGACCSCSDALPWRAGRPVLDALPPLHALLMLLPQPHAGGEGGACGARALAPLCTSRPTRPSGTPTDDGGSHSPTPPLLLKTQAGRYDTHWPVITSMLAHGRLSCTSPMNPRYTCGAQGCQGAGVGELLTRG